MTKEYQLNNNLVKDVKNNLKSEFEQMKNAYETEIIDLKSQNEVLTLKFKK